jgi:hypothetical protein
VKRVLCMCLSASIFLSGCGGRAAQPIQVRAPGDEHRSAEGLEIAISRMDDEIAAKREKRQTIFIGNVACGITGFFIIVPWFFMNFKDAEGTEIEALKQRKEWLTSIAESRVDPGVSTQPELEGGEEK